MILRRSPALLALLAAAFLIVPADAATLNASPGSINPRKITSVKNAVKKILATGKVPSGWTGNVAAGVAGTT
ncbi:MAG: hypothetical protein ACREKL_06225, partial [Chthoniobacterales bacterium]